MNNRGLKLLISALTLLCTLSAHAVEPDCQAALKIQTADIFDTTGVAKKLDVLASLSQDVSWQRVIQETDIFPWSMTLPAHSTGQPLARDQQPQGIARWIRAVWSRDKDQRLEFQPLKGLFDTNLSQWSYATVVETLRQAKAPREFLASLANQNNASDRFDKLLEWLVLQRDQAAGQNQSERTQVLVSALAHVTHAISSEHLFGDYSPLVMQILMGATLNPLGVLSPRLDSLQAAGAMTVALWRTQLELGIEQHQRLVADFSDRIRLRLPLADSPWIHFAVVPVRVNVDFNGPSGRNANPSGRTIALDPGQFTTFVDILMRKQPNLANSLRADPEKTARELRESFETYAQRTHVEYLHPKKGLEIVQLSLVDAEFARLFGVSTAQTPELFKYKMMRWYTSEILWRGWAETNRVFSEAQILSLFKNLGVPLVANTLLGVAYNTSDLGKVISAGKNAFAKYNQELIAWEPLLKTMTEHHQEGLNYRSSYGYSTSKSWTVGRAFAMGAMKVADYGQQHLHQDKVKSRTLIGVQRAQKDVDQGRIHQLDANFSYLYGRQQEVTGIAAAEPDSVSIVQIVNELGAVTTTYMRAPDNPAVILKFDGDYRPQRGDELGSFEFTRISL